ncbi:helix-turn-helix transcriptional regulator [Salinarimonas rosea]|uniref:helix-turn-helix transcriptional regulator n=1 Tax=Salinarimonas rosea TaxID=552063 RepID=UPI00041E76F2|nr:AraC family transcriptional regulator [Salinarimonas rosea]
MPVKPTAVVTCTNPPAEQLPDGLSAEVYGFTPGSVAVPPASTYLLSIHLGAPVPASGRADGEARDVLQREGDIDVLPPGVPGYWEDEVSARALAVRLPAAFVARAARRLGRVPRRMTIRPRFQLRDAALAHCGLALASEIEAGRPGGAHLAAALCEALALRLVCACGEEAPADRGAGAALSPARMAQLVAYVDARLDEPLTVRRLAAVAASSESHFKPAFRNACGEPAHRWLMRRRVERATALIHDGLPLAEVAAATGFSHQSHMARWTRRLLGRAPAEIARDAARSTASRAPVTAAPRPSA